jgi:hypothetical protein
MIDISFTNAPKENVNDLNERIGYLTLDNTELQSRNVDLEAQIATHILHNTELQSRNVDLSSQLSESRRTMGVKRNLTESFFKDAYDATDDDEKLTFSIDDINDLLSKLNIPTLTRIKQWAVHVDYSGNGVVFVMAVDEDEAREQVSDGGINVYFEGDCESSDFPYWNITTDVTNVELDE